MARTFIAIDLPDVIRRELAPADAGTHALAWSREAQLHLTLRFLGELPEATVDQLATSLAAVRVEPFLLALAGCGTFPPGPAAQVLWVGIGTGHPRLHQLRKRIDDAILALGLPADLRHFHPHVTLARLRAGHPADAFAPLLHRFAGYESPPFRVDRFGLYVSSLHPSGAIHRLVAEIPF